MDYFATATDMREKAWEEVVASPAFRAFRAADNMVIELGGQSVMPNLSTGESQAEDKHKVPRPRFRAADGKPKLTQAEVAASVLKELGPMGTGMLIDMAKEQGAAIGGAHPVNSFRSTLSKDSRFYSFRHGGEHLWWLTDVPLPEGWNRAADDLLEQAAALNHKSQEGGDGHAANNTVLTS